MVSGNKRSLVSCQWSVVRGPWSVVRGQWSVVIRDQWSVASGPWYSVVRVVRGVISDVRRLCVYQPLSMPLALGPDCIWSANALGACAGGCLAGAGVRGAIGLPDASIGKKTSA